MGRKTCITTWSRSVTPGMIAVILVATITPAFALGVSTNDEGPVSEPVATAQIYAHQFATQNPVMDPGFQIASSPWWDVSGGAVVAHGKLALPAGAMASQEFLVAGILDVGGIAPFVNVGDLAFRAKGSGMATLTLVDPETGRSFVALDASFEGDGSTVRLPIPPSARVERSSPLLLSFTGSLGGATIDDVRLEGATLANDASSPARLQGSAPRAALLNGGLEGAAVRENGFKLHFEGAALTSDARTGGQAADLAVGGAAPTPWAALGQVVAYPRAGTQLSEFDSFSYYFEVPAPLTANARLQHYFSLDADGDGDRDHCLLHTPDESLSQTAGWRRAEFDTSTLYFAGGPDCAGGPNALALGLLQSNPALGSARLLSVHVQTVVQPIAPWPMAQPVLIDDFALVTLEPDHDADGVPNSAESDLSDGFAVTITPVGGLNADAQGGVQLAPSRGVFIFDVQVYRYAAATGVGEPIPLDPARTAVFSLFDAEDLALGLTTESRNFVNQPGLTYWLSSEHPGAIQPLDARTLRVSVRAADVPALVDAGQLRSVGAWAFYDVADGDTYAAPYGLAEPASDYFSLARNAVRNSSVADAMPMAGTPLVLTLPPTDADDDGFSNDEEVSASLTPEEAIASPFDPRATPFDRDGDGFNNTEEDRDNDGIVEPALFETDPDNAASFPLPEISLSFTPTSPHEGDLVNFTANVNYASPLAPAGGHIVEIAWDFGDGATAKGASVLHAFSDARAYDVRVSVRENHGKSNTSDATVTVVNIPPVAAFTSSIPTDITQRTPAMFTSTSTDADGDVVAQIWKVDGVQRSTATAFTHSFTSDGAHEVCLTVADDKDATNTICQNVNVVNIVPTSSFNYASLVAPNNVLAATRAIEFDSTSDDTPDDITSYLWTLAPGVTSALASPTHAFPTAGSHLVQLRVTDDDGDWNESSQVLVIHALPVAGMTWTPALPDDRTIIQFSDTSTHPEGGDIVGWSWNFGDDATSNERDPLHQYANNADYPVTLKVTDALGVTSDVLTQTLTITNIAPTASFGVPEGEYLTSADVAFTDTSTDADSPAAVGWDWSFGDGSTSAQQSPLHRYASEPGTASRDYTVALRVRDDDGDWSAVTSRTITVLQDTDEDSTPDIRDADDDGDGYSDALEASHGTSTTSNASKPLDTDGDRTPDDDTPGFAGDTDDDKDGVSDADEMSAGSDPKKEASTPNDFDGDGVPNLVDSTLGRNAGNPAGHRDPCFPFEFAEACRAAGGPVDTDGDGWNDQTEDVLGPAGFHKADPTKPGVSPPMDTDADGVPDSAEGEICSRATIRDALTAAGVLGRCVSPTDYRPPQGP